MGSYQVEDGGGIAKNLDRAACMLMLQGCFTASAARGPEGTKRQVASVQQPLQNMARSGHEDFGAAGCRQHLKQAAHQCWKCLACMV